MKKVLIYFTDEEHKLLINVKGKLTWHDFVLKLTEKEIQKEANKE